LDTAAAKARAPWRVQQQQCVRVALSRLSRAPNRHCAIILSLSSHSIGNNNGYQYYHHDIDQYHHNIKGQQQQVWNQRSRCERIVPLQIWL
jgi:hypothetical protein